MVSVTYIAKRRLVNPLDDEISISFDLSSFSRSVDSKKSESKSIGGVIQSTLHYFTDKYSVTTAPIAPEDRAEFDEFMYSTMNNETFQMENIDDANNLIGDEGVVRIGSFSRDRVTKAKLDYYTYSFTIRENV